MNKQTVVYPRNGKLIVLHKQKEQTIYTCHNMNCKIIMLSIRKFLLKRVHTVWFHLHKILENANLSIVAESRPTVAEDADSRKEVCITCGTQGNLWVMKFIILSMVITVQVHTFVQTYQIVYFKYVWFIMCQH